MKTYDDKELIYAAASRCGKCGAGLAYPLDHDAAIAQAAWVCSAVLKGAVPVDGHTNLSFAMWDVRNEGSIRLDYEITTRPPGTRLLTQGNAECPRCLARWTSTPYSAPGLSHHWFSGPCPVCGYAVGGSGSWSSGEGEAIRTRFLSIVVLQVNAADEKAPAGDSRSDGND